MDGFMVWAREVDLTRIRTLETVHDLINYVYGTGQWAHQTTGTRMVVWTKVREPLDLTKALWDIGA